MKIEGLLGMLTIKLGDNNYTKWAFQFKSVLKGYKLFEHFDGFVDCSLRFAVHAETGVTKDITAKYQE